jgi:hypothetical protein
MGFRWGADSPFYQFGKRQRAMQLQGGCNNNKRWQPMQQCMHAYNISISVHQQYEAEEVHTTV